MNVVYNAFDAEFKEEFDSIVSKYIAILDSLNDQVIERIYIDYNLFVTMFSDPPKYYERISYVETDTELNMTMSLLSWRLTFCSGGKYVCYQVPHYEPTLSSCGTTMILVRRVFLERGDTLTNIPHR